MGCYLNTIAIHIIFYDIDEPFKRCRSPTRPTFYTYVNEFFKFVYASYLK